MRDEDYNTDQTNDLETIFKMRLPQRQVRFLRELGLLIFFCLGGVFMLAALGGAQYLICTSKNPDITFMQCMRHENMKGPNVKTR